jgi:hypothetical protein
VYAEESRFCLWQSDGWLRVRIPRRQRLNLQFALRRHSGLTPGVIVWGAIQFGSRSLLVFFQGSLNAARYINEALEPILLPYHQTHRNSVFQQVNARPYIAKSFK